MSGALASCYDGDDDDDDDGKKRIESLHGMMEGRDYEQFKDLISDRSRWTG